MKVAQTVLSLIALANTKAIADGGICTIFDTCAGNRSCCVAVAETKSGNPANDKLGLCVKDDTKVGT